MKRNLDSYYGNQQSCLGIYYREPLFEQGWNESHLAENRGSVPANLSRCFGLRSKTTQVDLFYEHHMQFACLLEYKSKLSFFRRYRTFKTAYASVYIYKPSLVEDKKK